jgi:hypothetical protein
MLCRRALGLASKHHSHSGELAAYAGRQEPPAMEDHTAERRTAVVDRRHGQERLGEMSTMQ